MGLDITVYENVDFDSFVDEDEIAEEMEDDMYHIYVVYDPLNQSDGIKSGYYNVDGYSKSFRAGSYSGYNMFRSILCESYYGFPAKELWEKMAQGDSMKGEPFVEMINFSDCEGVIGPKTSAKLYEDFVAHESDFEKFINEHSMITSDYKRYYIEKYKDWMEAFKIASNNGFVDFH
jgi:hypothetical protein